MSIQSLSQNIWVRPSREKSKLHKESKTHVIIIKKISRFLFIILWWKPKTRFISKFIFVIAYVRCIIILLTAGDGLKTSSLSCRPGLIRNIVHLPFCSPAVALESSFLFCRPDPASWETYFSFAGTLEKSYQTCRPVGNITSHLPVEGRASYGHVKASKPD